MFEKHDWFQGRAVINYDPHRGDMKRRTKWWVVADVIGGFDISRYYRYQIEKELLNPLGIDNIGSEKKYPFIKLCQPSWGSHISVIRGEKPKPELLKLWKKYDGMNIPIEYSHQVYKVSNRKRYSDDDGEFWCVKVRSPILINIRKEFDLPTDWGLHMTIGRVWQ